MRTLFKLEKLRNEREGRTDSDTALTVWPAALEGEGENDHQLRLTVMILLHDFLRQR